MTEEFMAKTEDFDELESDALREFEESMGVHVTTAGPGYLVGGGETEVENEAMYADKEQVAMEEAFEKMLVETKKRLALAEVDDVTAERAMSVLREARQLFVEPNEARADHAEYPFYLRIPTVSNTPVNVPAYRYPVDKLTALHEWVDTQLQKGHLEHSTSPFNAPMVLTRKKDGRWRFAIDLRGLNAIASFDPYALPRIPDLLDLTEGAKWFSALDLRDGYWNVLVHPEDRLKTAFTVPGKGRFQWRSTPFGYHGSGPHFQRAVEACLSGLSWREVAIYVDDILFFTQTLEEHVELARAVLGKLQAGGFTVHPGKCSFFANEIPYLGHKLSAKGVQADESLIQKIKDNLLGFSTKTEVRRALGIAQFYAKFVWQFASVAAPLSDAVKNGVKEDLSNLTEGQKIRMHDAARKLVELLTNAPVLALPDYGKEFVLITDASDVGIGAVLGQEGNDGNLRPIAFWSRKLSETERKYSATEREALAIVFFLEKFRHYLLGRRFLLKTDHAALKFVFKGAAQNSKLARWALKVQEFAFDLIHIPGKDNSVADALSRPADWSPVSEWNVDVQKGVYVRMEGETINEELIVPSKRWNLPIMMLSQEGVVDLKELQREDEVCGMAMRMIRAETDQGHTVQSHKIWKLVQEGILQMRNGLLVHVSVGRNWQDVLAEERIRVVAPRTIRRLIVADAHDAPWAGHFAVFKTTERVRNHWWWPGMGKEIKGWVDACQDCARAGKGHRQEYGLLQSIGPMMRPFERMAIDLIDLGSVRGMRPEYPYCLTVVDYATRFALAIPLRNKESNTIAQSLVDRVIAYFGPPEELLSDNAPELRDIVLQLNVAMGTSQKFTTTYHPRANGLVERFNGTFMEMMRVVLDEFKWKNWEKYAPMAQFAYNSAVQKSTGVSPYMLMFGREASTPLMERLGLKNDGKMGNEWLQNLTECRNLARDALARVHAEQKTRFDKRRKEPDFEVGDMVFVRSGAGHGMVGSKAVQKFKGPFRVHKFHLGESVVELKHDSTGDEITRVSVERVRKVRDEKIDRLSPVELRILGESVGMDEEKDSAAQDGHFELLTIHGDRMGDQGREFLVEYRMPKGAREGMWVYENDMDATEMIHEYWNRKARKEITAIEKWKRKCRWNGFDAGCKHLQCKAESWKEAMKDYLDDSQQDTRESKDIRRVQTKSGRLATRIELTKGRK